MKRFLAILLAMMLVLTMVMANVTAFAADGDDGTGNGTDTPAVEGETGNATTPDIAKNQSTVPTSFSLKKNYTVNGATAINPADELEFEVTKPSRSNSTTDFDAGDGDDKYDISIANVTVNEGATDATIVVKLGDYDYPGVYSYTITEKNTNKAGVTYLGDTLYLNVTVITDEANNGAMKVAGIAVHQAEEDGEKIDAFENKYDASKLTVSKTVTGNMGDYTLDFDFTVEFTAPKTGDVYNVVNADITITTPEGQAALTTAPTVIEPDDWTNGSVTRTFTLKHGQSVTFNNIPAGVKYVVTEASVTGYTPTKTGDEDTIVSSKVAEAKFTNDRNIDIDTGITLESLPYVLMMVLTMTGFAALKLRRREDY